MKCLSSHELQVRLSLRITKFQAENELRFAQADYDKQVEITRLLMEGLASIQGCRFNTIVNLRE